MFQYLRHFLTVYRTYLEYIKFGSMTERIPQEFLIIRYNCRNIHAPGRDN